MAKKTRTELSTLAINTNLPDNTQELITPTTERSQLTDERESVVNYKDDLGGTGNAGKFLTVAVDGESLTMVDAPTGDVTGTGVAAQVTFWDGTNNITSDAMLVVDDTNKVLKIIIPSANASGGISIDQQGTTGTGTLQFLDDGVYKAQIVYNVSDGNLTLNSNGDIEITPTGDTVISGGTPSVERVRISSGGDATFTKTISAVDSTAAIIINDTNDGVLGGIGARASGTYPLQIWGGTLELKTGSSADITAATTKLTISSGGLATFANGIKFGGTPSPAYDSGADTLDAYEEGTFTVAILASITNPTTTGQNTTGYYTRVGNVVTVQYYSSAITVTNSGSGSAYLAGLPYQSKSTVYQTLSITHVTCFAATVQNGYIDVGTSNFYPIQENSTNFSTWKVGTGYIMIGGSYLI